MNDVTEIIKALTSLMVAIIVTFVIPYIKERVDSEKLNKALTWVKVAVQCAEQIYNASGMGKEKKAYVIEFLESNGITYNESEIDALIESAVLELKKKVSK